MSTGRSVKVTPIQSMLASLGLVVAALVYRALGGKPFKKRK